LLLLFLFGQILVSFFPVCNKKTYKLAIGYIQYKAGTNLTIGLWSFDPTPYGGDLLVTILIQTALTYLISGFLISKDLGENFRREENHLISHILTCKIYYYRHPIHI
jgi:hypothetical protein